MRAITVLAAAAAIGALTAGCGQPAVRQSGAPDARQAAALARCVTPRLGPGKTVSLTQRDNGKAFCVPAGTGIYVFLHGSQRSMWRPIHPGSDILRPRPSGMFALARGVTAGFFGADRVGTATLTSTRPPCRVAGSSARCAPGTRFTVTVVIRG